MQQFQITLKNEKIRFYNQISWIIIFIHIVIFVYLAFYSKTKSIQSGSIAALVMMLLCFMASYYLKKIKSVWVPGFHIFYMFLMVSWISIGWYWVAVIPGVFDILYTIVTIKLLTIFSEEKIVYPSFPNKSINWNEINNIILKDGLLTIDFKNNKLIQQTIDESKTSVDEKEFNDFCRDQIITSNQKPAS